jgi:F-type H+-transporting ATPase subunit delta
MQRVTANLLRLGHSTSRSFTRGFADASQMKFTFACPAQVFYTNANVRQVDVPSFSGSFGILPMHVPVLAVLKPGIVSVFEEAGPKKYFVSSGTVTVNDDSSVQILAEEACALEDLDLQAAREGFSKSQQKVNAARDEKERAEALISVEVHEAMVKAIELGI